MKVFADFHHDDLYHSLHLLFEKRLGWELYCPVGMDWYKEGFWRYSLDPKIVKWYLMSGWKWEDKGKYCLYDNPQHERKLKALTLDQFKEMDIDIIISSLPDHAYCYQNLIRKHKPKAKLIQQVGNEWPEFDYSIVKNLMVSCKPFDIPHGVNAVFYHQEFDLKQFNFTLGKPKDPIKSFVNDMMNFDDWELFKRYERRLKQRKWKSYGIGCRDGNLRPLKKLVKEMKSSSFFFHAKPVGDGFGHVIHNAFALGRPPIVRAKYYKDRAAELLMIDGVTCIDLDAHLFWQNCKLIEACLGQEKYEQMSKDAKQRFDDIVNFDAEFKFIKKFLARLQ